MPRVRPRYPVGNPDELRDQHPDWALAAGIGLEGLRGGFVEGYGLGLEKRRTNIAEQREKTLAKNAQDEIDLAREKFTAEQAKRAGYRAGLERLFTAMRPPEADYSGVSPYAQKGLQEERARINQSLADLEGTAQYLGPEHLGDILREARDILGPEVLANDTARLTAEIDFLSQPDPEGNEPVLDPKIAEGWIQALQTPDGIRAQPIIREQIGEIKANRAAQLARNRAFLDGTQRAAMLRQTVPPKNAELFDELESQYRDGLYVHMTPEDLETDLRMVSALPPDQARAYLDRVTGRSRGPSADQFEGMLPAKIGGPGQPGFVPDFNAFVEALKTTEEPAAELAKKMGIDLSLLSPQEGAMLEAAVAGAR